MSNNPGGTKYRTLFVGLGGTGGEVLCRMLECMKALTPDQRARAHMIYLDTDKRDTDKLSAKGVPAINIGSSDTVRDIIRYLGDDDGVLDWIAADRNDNEFLSSKTDDGASQFRLKSRLCLAKFLKNPNNELKRMLDSVSVVGSELEKETLRVIIVSSIAGGTGAGTFVQIALYLRECFRQRGHNDISITGLFACPDLFAKTSFSGPGDIENVENMYSNAYAAVRELNAMNLVVDSQHHETSQGYGNAIHIAINTKSEGLLFDSQNPLFSSNSNYKPYNQIYFVDESNISGGVLRTMDQYYSVMADIAFTRMFSPLESTLRSDESNELGIHQSYPTAIYGSAGYGKVIYPYEGILDYLAVRKTHYELDYTWNMLENEWDKYKRNQKMMAKESGRRWSPTSDERGARFMSDFSDVMGKHSSPLRHLAPMVKDPDADEDRAAEFLRRLNESLASATGLEANPEDAPYGLCKDEKAARARDEVAALYADITSQQSEMKDAAAYIDALASFASGAETGMKDYVHALVSNAPGRAHFVSSVVVPRNERDGQVAQNGNDPLNLFHGLLSLDGKAVHPLAARYLLYSLRKQMKERMAANSGTAIRSAMADACEDLRLALDPNPSDDKDITVDIRVAELEKTFFLLRAGEAEKALQKYLSKFVGTMNSICALATDNLICEVYARVLEVVEVLIAQYEGLFDNLEQYQNELRLRLAREQSRHEVASDDRCIFVNGSRAAKEDLYSKDPQTTSVLDASSDVIDAAAGEGVYLAMMQRTWVNLEQMENAILLEDYQDDEVDTFSDLGDVFNNIVEIYKDYLKKNAPHLQSGVVRALIRECCRLAGVSESKLTNPDDLMKVRNLFESVIGDMMSKAEPMLNYEDANDDPYFTGEKDDIAVKVAKLYTHIGMHPDAIQELKMLYPGTDDDDVQAAFDNVVRPTRGSKPSEEFSNHELICFKVVHCLQPTQIRKFREDYHQGFYHYYKKRLAKMHATGCKSFTPHLDKRWHLREAMPYISRAMDVAWHHKTARAFVYEILDRRMTFAVDDNDVTCFNYTRRGQEQGAYVRWPDTLVTINDISRLLEFLQEQDERIDAINALMDEEIATMLEYVSKHADSMPVYKATLTTYDWLKTMRCNLLARKQTVSTTRLLRNKKSYVASGEEDATLAAYKDICAELGIEEMDLIDAKETLGGLMEIAWKVHRSEERQGRDHDFGECIVKVALDIIEQLCQTMCGVNVSPDSDFYGEYVDLYNSLLDKFMEPFVVSILGQLRYMDADKLREGKSVIFRSTLKVPYVVTQTAEYAWADRLLERKK